MHEAQDLGRDGGRPRDRQRAGIHAEFVAQLGEDQVVEQGVALRQGEGHGLARLLQGHLLLAGGDCLRDERPLDRRLLGDVGLHACVELLVHPRDAGEERRAAILQVRDQLVEGLGEPDLGPQGDRCPLPEQTLEDVRKREVRDHAVAAAGEAHDPDPGRDGLDEVAVGQHHPFGLPGGAGGVDDRGGIVTL